MSGGPASLDVEALARLVRGLIVEVPDFPQPGVTFQDVTPVLADPVALDGIVGWLAGLGDFDVIAGIEARGFVFGAPAALRAGVPFVPVRKAGKLPRAVLEESFELEYGQATLAVHIDAVTTGQRVLVVDDILATGGTAAAAASLVERAGGVVTGLAVVLEIAGLSGRNRVSPLLVHALLSG